MDHGAESIPGTELVGGGKLDYLAYRYAGFSRGIMAGNQYGFGYKRSGDGSFLSFHFYRDDTGSP